MLVGVATLEAENKDSYDSALAHATAGLSALERAAEKDWNEIAMANRIIALCHVRRREPEAAIACCNGDADPRVDARRIPTRLWPTNTWCSVSRSATCHASTRPRPRSNSAQRCSGRSQAAIAAESHMR